MSLVDFSRQLLKLDGSLIEEVVGKDEKGNPKIGVMTVRSFTSSALQAPMQGDERMGIKEREQHFDLLLKVHTHPVLDLSAEEIALIKNRIVRTSYSNLLVGQVLKILEGKDTGLDIGPGKSGENENGTKEFENKETSE